MAKSKPTLQLSASRDIPFDKLVLSQANVRRIKAGVSIEELAEDIARRTLLQSLTVRPVVDEAGHETGLFEVPAGGRRYRALELLVKQKRLAKDAPIPCVIRTEGVAEEDSLAENVQRAPLHPLDQFSGEQPPLTPEQEAAKAALEAEFEEIEAQFGDGEDFTEEADQRLSEIETALAEIDDRPEVFEANEKGHAGAFVSLDGSGRLKVERGFVRPEDEPPVEEPASGEAEGEADQVDGGSPETGSEAPADEPEEDDGLKPLPDRLVTELTAHRTVALRNAVGEDPAVAYLAVLHAFVLRLFYTYGSDSCLEVDAKSPVLGAQAPGLGDTPAAQAIDARHEAWRAQLPTDSRDLWDGLCGFDTDSREALFAHCVGLTVNAVQEPWNRRPRAIAHADRLAQAVKLDMVAAGWKPTVDTFFGRVTKARILAAVRDACGEAQAQLIDHLKKDDMAAKAEEAMSDSGWLPEPLRTRGGDSEPEITPDEAEAIIESQVIAAE